VYIYKMNGGFFPNVVNPRLRPQTQSEEFQTPFFFGGSQTPNALSMSGSGFKKTGVFVGSGLKKSGVYVSGCGMLGHIPNAYGKVGSGSFKGLIYKPYTGMNK